MSASELADEAQVHANTISRLEKGGGIRSSNAEALRAVFEARGVVFVSNGFTTVDGEGVAVNGLGSPLRDSHYDWAKSAYAVMINPWVSREDNEALLVFRGTIIAAYAQIETRLAEVAIRASRLDAYASLREKYPHGIDKRVAYLRRVFGTGPLASYRDAAGTFLTKFEAGKDIRNLMAHGRMEQVGDSRGWGVTFIDYTGNAEGAVYRRVRLNLGQLERLAWRASRFSRLGERLLYWLDQTSALPKMPDDLAAARILRDLGLGTDE